MTSVPGRVPLASSTRRERIQAVRIRLFDLPPASRGPDLGPFFGGIEIPACGFHHRLQAALTAGAGSLSCR